MHGGGVALADRKRQFHPDMDVTEEQRYTSPAGGMRQKAYPIDADRVMSRMECFEFNRFFLFTQEHPLCQSKRVCINRGAIAGSAAE